MLNLLSASLAKGESSVSKAQYRRNHTAQVAVRDEEGKILVPNGHKGRSQKGCFGKPEYSQKEKKNGKNK